MASIRIRLPTRSDLTKMLKRPMQAVADKAVAIIVARTARGIDANGVPFRPYTQEYRLAKVASGRKGTPDLTVTGKLLAALRRLTVSPDGKHATIGFEGQHRNAQFLTAGKKAFVSDLATKRTLRKKRTSRVTRAKAALGTTPYAVLVPSLNARREFFAIRLARELDVLVAVYQRVLDEEIRRANQDGKKF